MTFRTLPTSSGKSAAAQRMREAGEAYQLEGQRRLRRLEEISMSETYRIVTTRFRGISPTGKAIFVDRPIAGEVSIPRSLIHGADDRKLADAFDGEEITFRLMDWKAEEIGFA